MRLTASRHCGNPMQGKILGGHYQIISHLGGGGFGTTFVAEDRHLPGNPRCVVKQLKPKTADNALAWEAARRLFNREAEVLYQLGNHHQIPRLFAHFEQDQEFYLVQELIEGHELRQELAAVGQLNEVDVINILREILEILVFVHQQNVIHRDIKPANIIRRKQDEKLVLIDFGAVKQFSNQVIDSQGFSSMTIAVGSPGYMPNEQLAGKPRFSSDIYAVGMMGIQALTGLSPRQLPEDPKTCEIVWRNSVEISAELADVLDKMVRYDFRQRYQSASEALEAINSVPAILSAKSIQISFLTKITEIHSLPTKTFVSDELSSERGIDYTRLRDLLTAGKWKEADLETKTVILKAVDRDEEGWLRSEDIDKFSCTDLRTIDSLWVKYSNDRFGFSVQRRIYEDLGGNQQYNKKIWSNFRNCIGWSVNDNWLYYDNLTFAIDAPFGHLPVGIWGSEGIGDGVGFFALVIDIFYRVETCKIAPHNPVIFNIKQENLSDNLYSDCGVDYSRLRDLLVARKWEQADRETKVVILKAVGREEEGRLIVEDIENLPSSDLRTMDNLWMKYSNGRFGFSVQKRIWENLGGKKDATRDVDYQTWRRFGEQVGWRVNGSWLVSEQLNFTLNAAVGHLPALPNRRWWGLNYHLILRYLESCGLDDSTDISSEIEQEDPTDDLSSERGIDYINLRNLLRAEKWEEADRETTAIALRICNRLTKGWLTEEDIQNFPCADLFTIDQLWVKYSQGRFGFSIQAHIWKQVGGTWNAKYVIYKCFSRYVGWSDGTNTWVASTKNLTFDTTAPAGHLPGGMLDWLWFKYREVAPDGAALVAWWNILSALTSKIEACDKLFSPNQIVNLLPASQSSIKNRIAVVEGDIIQQKVDAIVNSTDPSFSGIGLLDNAVQRAAGSQLREACRQLICTTGEARITGGYNLSARWIIHTVSPGWWDWDDNHQQEELLAQCYRNCLALAEQYAIKTIAFPAIRTGELGFPIEIGCKIAVREVIAFLEKNSSIEKVIFTCFGKNWQQYYDCYLTAIEEILR